MLARTLVASALLTMMSIPAAAQSLQLRQVSGTRLDVVATGQVTRVPDIVRISVGIATEAPSASEAIATNRANMDRLRAALERAGIAPRDIQTERVALNAQWTQQLNGRRVFAGYRVDHRLNVRFREAAQAGRILDLLVGAGATEIDGPNFELADNNAALDEARFAALADARARADRYASSLGLRVARVLSVVESGASQPLAGGVFAGRGNMAATNLAFGEESVGFSLAVSFELE